MTTDKRNVVKVVKEVAAPAQQVFGVLCVFDGIKPGGPIEAVRYEGQGVGMQRFISMGGGLVVERLEVFDVENRIMSYVIVNEDCPLPFDNYSSTVLVNDNGDNTSTVEWTGNFDARGDEQVAINTASGIYAGAIKGAKIKLGVN